MRTPASSSPRFVASNSSSSTGAAINMNHVAHKVGDASCGTCWAEGECAFPAPCFFDDIYLPASCLHITKNTCPDPTLTTAEGSVSNTVEASPASIPVHSAQLPEDFVHSLLTGAVDFGEYQALHCSGHQACACLLLCMLKSDTLPHI